VIAAIPMLYHSRSGVGCGGRNIRKAPRQGQRSHRGGDHDNNEQAKPSLHDRQGLAGVIVTVKQAAAASLIRPVYRLKLSAIVRAKKILSCRTIRPISKLGRHVDRGV